MKKVLAAVAAAGFVLLGVAAPAHAAADPAQNKTSYWENYTSADDTCHKVEFGDGVGSFVLPTGQSYTLLVLKAGTGNTVIEFPNAGEEYWSDSGKDLSHAIYCVGDYGGYPG